MKVRFFGCRHLKWDTSLFFMGSALAGFLMWGTGTRADTIETMRSTPSFAVVGDEWGHARHPTRPPVEIIGQYDAGCLRGASLMPWDGSGFHVVRATWNRYYGHPDLLAFLTELGRESLALGIGDLLYADLGQPRGGPMLTGHKSHQIGLDVDVWFRILPSHNPPLDDRTRESLKTFSLLRADGKGLDSKKWSVVYEQLLRAASLSDRVARIFVNPHIKSELCRRYSSAGDALWLRKLRPWWGHDDHLHARLHCPPESSKCVEQAEVGPGSGCDEVPSWFNPDGTVKAPPASTPKPLLLPSECEQVLKEP